MDNSQNSTPQQSMSAPTPIVTPPTVSSDQPIVHVAEEQKSPFFSKTLGIILAVVLLLIVIGGAGAYYYINNTPEVVMGTMLDNMSKVKTIGYEGDMKIEIDKSVLQQNSFFANPQLSNQISGVDIHFAGQSDRTNPLNPQASLDFSLTTIGSVQNAFVLGFTMVSTGKVVYVKATNLPPLGIDLSSFKNKWIKIDIEDLQRKYGNSLTNSKTQLTPEDIKKIKELEKQTKIYTKITKLSDDTLLQGEAYHYSVTFDKQALETFLVKYLEIVQSKPLTLDQKDSLLKSFNEINISDAEVWIGKKDKLFYKITDVLSPTRASPAKGVSISLTLQLKDHNKPTTIQIPTDSTNFDDILQQFMQQMRIPQQASPTLQPQGVKNPSTINGDTVLGAHTNSKKEQIRQQAAKEQANQIQDIIEQSTFGGYQAQQIFQIVQ